MSTDDIVFWVGKKEIVIHSRTGITGHLRCPVRGECFAENALTTDASVQNISSLRATVITMIFFLLHQPYHYSDVEKD